MIVPLTEGPGGGGEEGGGGLLSHPFTTTTPSLQLGCNCGSGEADSMTDTVLTVLCQENVTCTALKFQPGATIVSPILLSLSGVTGQIWALYYLYTSTRPQHSRTVFFLLLSTLIWTDLVGKIITTPPALVAYTHGKWVGGVPLCNFHGFSMMLISLVTHLLVSTMAVERFIGIRHGYFYNKNITTTRTKLVLLCIWLFSVLFCALPLFGVGQYALQYPGSWCFVNIHVDSSSSIIHRIYTNVFGLFTLVNLLIMVVCNIVVIIALVRKAMARRGGPCQATLLCLRLCRRRCPGNHICAPHRSYKQRELEMQMVIVLLVITVVFLISWSPIDMRLFLNQIWPHTTREDHIQDLIAVRLTSINQIIDPWAYIICRKMFATKAWRWMRLSLLGSRLLGRESSSHPDGSKKKGSTRQQEKIQYRPPFKEADDAGDLNRGVVVVVEGDALLSPHHRHHHHHHHHHPPPTTTIKEGAEGGEGEEGKEVFRDSGTGSNNNTPSTVCSDSGAANCNVLPDDGGGVVPIPVFRSQQYRVCPPSHAQAHAHAHAHTRLKRITSSASARAASTSRHPALAHEPSEATSDTQVSCSSIPGRRHSWCCPHDAADAKQYRTQSTQTFRPDPGTHTGDSKRGAGGDVDELKRGPRTQSNELNELGMRGDCKRNAYNVDHSCQQYSNSPFLLPSHAFYQQDKGGGGVYTCGGKDSCSPSYSSPNSFYSPQNSFSFRDSYNNSRSPRSTCSSQANRGIFADDFTPDQEDDSVFIVADAATRLRTASESCCDREHSHGLSCENHTLRHRDWRELC